MKFERRKYPDGGNYAVVTDFSDGKLSIRINTYEDLFYLKSIKDVLDNNGIKDVHLFIPCMFQQQHDRRFNENESFELKLVADWINSMNFAKVHIFHPHSDATGIAVNNARIYDNAPFITEVLRQLNNEDLVLLSPDAGAFKWIFKLAEKIGFKGNIINGNKSRDKVTHKTYQTIEHQDFEGKDVLVLDDICVMGGTFLTTSAILKTRNVGKLYLATSHMTVQKPNITLETAYDRIFTTNSKYDSYELSNVTVVDYMINFNDY